MIFRKLRLWLSRSRDTAHWGLFWSERFAQEDLAHQKTIVTNLREERADLTEIIASLVAKDDDGNWTTVFDADTRLPDAYQLQLNTLVNQS